MTYECRVQQAQGHQEYVSESEEVMEMITAVEPSTGLSPGVRVGWPDRTMQHDLRQTLVALRDRLAAFEMYA